MGGRTRRTRPPRQREGKFRARGHCTGRSGAGEMGGGLVYVRKFARGLLETHGVEVIATGVS